MVHTGEKISVDGVAESGEAAVDQASITGEYMPLRKAEGDEVFAGTVVKSGRLVIRAVKVGDQTAVARIVHMVEEATHRKANVQTIADRFSAQFIPVNFLLALIVYAVTGKSSRAEHAHHRLLLWRPAFHGHRPVGFHLHGGQEWNPH